MSYARNKRKKESKIRKDIIENLDSLQNQKKEKLEKETLKSKKELETLMKIEQDIENLLEEYKNLKETKIIQNKNIRKGQPIIEGTRLTCIDILMFMVEFIKEYEKEFRKNYADINSQQIMIAINYLLENSVLNGKNKIEESKKLIEEILNRRHE